MKSTELTVMKGSELAQLSESLLVKGSGIIQIRVTNGEKRSLLGRKLSNALFKIAQKQGMNEDTYSTTRIELGELIQFNSNDVDKLKQAANELTSLKVEMDVTNASGVRTVGATQLFSTLLFQSSGKIHFEIPTIAKRMLSDSVKFALINMDVQGNIDSNYAYILYEQCLLYLEDGRTPELTVQEWRQVFECDDDSIYNEFKYFNLKVIKNAIEEVNRVTDILVSVQYTKVKRVVKSLFFEITKKPQYLLDVSIQDEQLRAEEKLIECGVNENVAKKLAREYEFELVMGNIEYAESQLADGKIKNLAGFVVEAIKNDYRPKVSPLVVKFKEQQAQSKKDAAERLKVAEREQFEQNKIAAEKNSRAGEYYETLDDDSKEKLFRDFESFLEQNNRVTLKSFKKNGIESKTVRMALLNFISKNVLKIAE